MYKKQVAFDPLTGLAWHRRTPSRNPHDHYRSQLFAIVKLTANLLRAVQNHDDVACHRLPGIISIRRVVEYYSKVLEAHVVTPFSICLPRYASMISSTTMATTLPQLLHLRGIQRRRLCSTSL